MSICCADDREFTFTSALQTHFSVRPLGDYPQSSQFVKLLGLGGKRILDYSADPSHPRLTEQTDDYVHFGGEQCSELPHRRKSCVEQLSADAW